MVNYISSVKAKLIDTKVDDMENYHLGQ